MQCHGGRIPVGAIWHAGVVSPEAGSFCHARLTCCRRCEEGCDLEDRREFMGCAVNPIAPHVLHLAVCDLAGVDAAGG